MKHYSINFPSDPFIPTEETMFKRLLETNSISDEYTLCSLPLANIINKLSVYSAQEEINKIKVEGKKIFVCQHILVDQLKFDENSIVATPHVSTSNNYISIPHYPVNCDPSKAKQERSFLFSFMGSTQTHEIRRGLTILYPNNCFDTGHLWALDPSIPEKEKLEEKYIDLLGDTNFSLCPRGTGISSVRLFESMAMGAIPVIIADGYRPPLSNVINWNEISVIIKSNQISKIGPWLSQSTSPKKIEDMRAKMKQVYDEFLSPENFHRSIELGLLQTAMSK